MRQQRHDHFRPGSPPHPGYPVGESGIGENRHFHRSYQALGSALSDHDHRYRLVSGREGKQSCGGECGRRSPPPLRNPETENAQGNRCIWGLSRSNEPARVGIGRFTETALVHRRELSDERDGQWQKPSAYRDSLMGAGRESTFKKFSWDNMLDDKRPTNAITTTSNNPGSFCDLSVVPTSFRHMVVPSDSSSRSRSYGFSDDGHLSSPLELRDKRIGISFPDSNLERIDGKTDIENDTCLIRQRNILLENDTSFGEADRDSRTLKLSAENLQYLTEAGFGRPVRSYRDGFDRFYSNNCYSQRMVVNHEEASETILRRKSSSDMETGIDNKNIMSSCDLSPCDAFVKIPGSIHGVGHRSKEDIEILSMLGDSGWGQYPGEIDEMGFHESSSSGNSLSSRFGALSKQRQSRKHYQSSKRDIKQRLGPVQSVKQRLGPLPNVGKSVRRVAPIIKKKVPWVRKPKENFLNAFDHNSNVKKVTSSEVKKNRTTKIELPEDSVEFMQHVQNAFLKFVKLLNENSFNRRKYLEEGRAGTLRCSICGSSTKEFVDTLSLAQHAFMSSKIGSRSEHFGLHKAICVLMGWDNTKGSNGQWTHNLLSESKASSLKEDLIIWPPVLFIHNSSVTNYNPNERMIVSIEEVKDILRGMGCDQGMTSICRGKAANQSTMVVSFNGTFSGLKVAERLHGIFGEKKHGRVEFDQIIYQRCEETKRMPADKVESVLFGYLGIASDLDKLDFETKKRCVVKSKKEIDAIANATSNTG